MTAPIILLLAAGVESPETFAYTAATDEASYVEAILPLLPEVSVPVSPAMPWDDDSHAWTAPESPYGP